MQKVAIQLVAITIMLACVVNVCFGQGSLPLPQRFAAAAKTVDDFTIIPICSSDGVFSISMDTEGQRIITETKEVFMQIHPDLKIVRSSEYTKGGKFLFIILDHPSKKKKATMPATNTCILCH